MKTYEEIVREYRKRQHDTVVDTIATGLTYVDEIAIDTGLLEETGVLFTPGAALGAEGTVRIGYANNVRILREGLEAVSGFLKGVGK